MQRPWMQLYTRDWLDNKELRRCSPLARAVLLDLMCLANEGTPHGHLADKMGPLTVAYMTSRCFVDSRKFLQALTELETHRRVQRTEDNVLFIARMVDDEKLRIARAEGGKKSVGHPNTHPRKESKGTLDSDINGTHNGHPPTSARTRAEGDLKSSLEKRGAGEKNGFPVCELVAACFDRHEKRDKMTRRETVVAVVAGKNLDWQQMAINHNTYVEHWAGRWRYNPETFLAWVENGMPVPSPDRAEAPTESATDRAIRVAHERVLKTGRL